ncbi:MAG: hypothetical protein FVQ77_03385 [Cytophagales bacterium]|nr:hypothetical protein [Cytophagales bacterium]
MNTIICIFRELSQKDIYHLKGCDKNNTIIYYENERYLPDFLNDQKKIKIALSREQLTELNNISFREVVDFGHRTFVDKKVIKWLSFNNSNGWYYIRIILYFRYRYQLIEIEKVSAALAKIKANKYEVNKLVIFTSTRNVSLILPDTVNSEIILPSGGFKKGAIFNFVSAFALRAIQSAIKIPQLLNSGKYIILANADTAQPVYSFTKKKLVKGDQNIEYLLEHTYNDNEFIFLSELAPPSLDNIERERAGFKWKYPINKFKKKTYNYEFFLLLGLLNPLNYQKLIKFKKQLIIFEHEAKDKFTKWEDRLMVLCIGSTRNMMLLALFRELCAKVFLKFVKCKAIIATVEHTLTAKSIINIARQNKVVTFGIQHGIIYPFHMHYYYVEQDKEYVPWPDFTILWGKQWQKILTSVSTYPVNATKVLGQLRTDIIPFLKNLRKNQVLNNFDSNKPVILYISQSSQQGMGVQRKRITEDFFKLTKKYQDYQFIIKPHPGEIYFDYFYNIASEIGTKNFHIVNEDLYKLLAISDLVIVFTSTVGAEAVYFEKDLIVIDYYDNDLSGYVKDKVAFKASNYQELELLTREIIRGNKKINNELQKEFILSRANKIDGKVTKRYVDFIKANA